METTTTASELVLKSFGTGSLICVNSNGGSIILRNTTTNNFELR
jgi:hypothetical protein